MFEVVGGELSVREEVVLSGEEETSVTNRQLHV